MQRWRIKLEQCVHLSMLWGLILLPCTVSPHSTLNVVDSYKPLDFQYHNYEEMKQYLQHVSDIFPNLTSMYSIGKSVKGKELLALVVTSKLRDEDIPPGTPNIKFIGNIHGNEAVGKELVLHMIEYLVTNYKVNDTVTRLLNTTRIHFLPSMNPDGFEIAREMSCRAGPGRNNKNDVDLNRSFPDHFRVNLIPLQPETKAVMDWMSKVPFILSASLHGGALVANYPFENQPVDVPITPFRPSVSPDDDVFRHLAKVYAQTHPTMHEDSGCKPNFEGGITNGAAWYPLTGGMQDYNYVWHGCMEITLEISCCKYPSHKDLEKHWRENKDALLKYADEAHQGVKGIITDHHTGKPIAGARLQITGRKMYFNSTEKGEFWRILLPSKTLYYIEVEAKGYKQQKVGFHVLKNNGNPNWVNITLKYLNSTEDETSPQEKSLDDILTKKQEHNETELSIPSLSQDQNYNIDQSDSKNETHNLVSRDNAFEKSDQSFQVHSESEKQIQTEAASLGSSLELNKFELLCVTFFAVLMIL